MGYCWYYALAYQYILQQIYMSTITGVPYSLRCSFVQIDELLVMRSNKEENLHEYIHKYTMSTQTSTARVHKHTLSTQAITQGRKGVSFLESVGGGTFWCRAHVTQGTRPNESHATSPPAHTAMRSLALWKNSTHGLKSFFFPHWAVTCRRSP